MFATNTGGLRRRIKVRTYPKQTAEERAAKMAACNHKQALKRRNRWHQYSRGILLNPLRTITLNV